MVSLLIALEHHFYSLHPIGPSFFFFYPWTFKSHQYPILRLLILFPTKHISYKGGGSKQWQENKPVATQLYCPLWYSFDNIIYWVSAVCKCNQSNIAMPNAISHSFCLPYLLFSKILSYPIGDLWWNHCIFWYLILHLSMRLTTSKFILTYLKPYWMFEYFFFAANIFIFP